MNYVNAKLSESWIISQGLPATELEYLKFKSRFLNALVDFGVWRTMIIIWGARYSWTGAVIWHSFEYAMYSIGPKK